MGLFVATGVATLPSCELCSGWMITSALERSLSGVSAFRQTPWFGLSRTLQNSVGRVASPPLAGELPDTSLLAEPFIIQSVI